jgi:copper chaperone NosL
VTAPRLIGLAIVTALALLVVFVVRGAGTLPDEPVPVAWDRDVCAHCGMHVGEPRHAAQLVTTDGRVHNFDDVGCALDYLEQHRPAIHRLWFHGEGDAWIPAAEAGFVAAPYTPMGSGLLAVDRAVAGARSFDEVRATPRAAGGGGPGAHPGAHP